MKNQNYKILKGRDLQSIRISKDKTVIELNCDNDNKFYLVAEGDCCSESRFWSVKSYIGVKSVNIIDDCNKSFPVEIEEASTQEHDVIYPFVFTEPNGGILLSIVMRNSSNGYYGGYMSLLESNNPFIKTVEWR